MRRRPLSWLVSLLGNMGCEWRRYASVQGVFSVSLDSATSGLDLNHQGNLYSTPQRNWLHHVLPFSYSYLPDLKSSGPGNKSGGEICSRARRSNYKQDGFPRKQMLRQRLPLNWGKSYRGTQLWDVSPQLSQQLSHGFFSVRGQTRQSIMDHCLWVLLNFHPTRLHTWTRAAGCLYYSGREHYSVQGIVIKEVRGERESFLQTIVYV